MGALVTHITGRARAKAFQPMNVNFGLFLIAPRGPSRHAVRYKAYTDRAKQAFTNGFRSPLRPSPTSRCILATPIPPCASA